MVRNHGSMDIGSMDMVQSIINQIRNDTTTMFAFISIVLFMLVIRFGSYNMNPNLLFLLICTFLLIVLFSFSNRMLSNTQPTEFYVTNNIYFCSTNKCFSSFGFLILRNIDNE